MKNKFLISSIIMLGISEGLMAACSGGMCSSSAVVVPSDMSENESFSFLEEEKKKYNAWIMTDNAGDDAVGKNRLMGNIDINSILGENDRFSIFGLISSENLKNGKITYNYPIPSLNNLTIEASYSYSNYVLDLVIPTSTGIGTMNSVEGKILYPLINEKNNKTDIYLTLNNNNIEENVEDDFFPRDTLKSSYSGTIHLDIEKTSDFFKKNKLAIALRSGYLDFDNEIDKQSDALTFNRQGNYTKLNIDYKNTLQLSENFLFDTNIRTQFAFNDKYLDDSEAFSAGGMNGVKVYQQSSLYGSNGLYGGVEAKYILPEINGLKNKIGVFYDYGTVWDPEIDFLPITGSISAQDVGIGLYTNYKGFFSKVQGGFEIGDSDVETIDGENYRVLFQIGYVY